MRATIFTLLLALCWSAGAQAQGVYVKKEGVNPSFLTKHGVYYSVEETESEQGPIFHTLFFYNDGTFYIGGYDYFSKTSMLKKLDEFNNPYRDHESLLLNDAWGSYYISNDTIYMRRFSYTPGNEFSTLTTGMIAVIKSDSSFCMLKETCDWCGINEYFGPQGHVYSKPIQYHFHALDRLPDPSMAWFRKKAWFREGNNEQTFAAIR